MASPFWASSGVVLSGSGANASFAAPAGVQANSIVVVDFFLGDINSDQHVVPPDSSWFLAENMPQAAANQYHYVYWHRASGVEAGPYLFTWDPGSHFREGQAHRYEGAVTGGNPWDAGAQSATTGSSNVSVSPAVSITTLGDERLLVHAATCWAGGTWTPQAGYTKRQQGPIGLATVSDKAQALAGTSGVVQATSTLSNTQTAWLGALKPAGALAVFSVAGAVTATNLLASLTLTFTNGILPVTSTIEWGDGITTLVSGAGPHTHLYDAAGTYAIMVTSTDAGAQTDATALPVTVTAAPGALHVTSELVACAWLKTISGITAGMVATTLPAPAADGTISWASTGFVQVAGVGGATGVDYRLRMPAIGITCHAVNQSSSKPPWGKANQLAEQIIAAAEQGSNWRLTPDKFPGNYRGAHVQNVRCSEPRRLSDDGGGYARYVFDIYMDWIEVP